MKKIIFILIFSGIFFTPFLSFAQNAPDLGKASDFVLFTSSGAITNTPATSNFIGNVGSNDEPDAGYPVSGFGNINGQIHNIDAESMQCAADLASAYNDLSAQASTQPDPSIAGVLGNGVTLRKGVYSMGIVTSLSGNLILDAEGDANAVFIFKVGAAFNSSVGAKIFLTNAALACNVFWQIGGAVTLSSLTSFKGSIIANGAVILNAGDTLEGRALTIAGAITTSGITAATPIGCGSLYLTGPIKPTLATLNDYELYTADGQIANGGLISLVADVGPSYIVGNIGTNFGIIAGFEPPSEVIGIININNAATAQAKTELDVAYADVNTLAYYTQLLSPATFGNDLVLTPHTYFISGETLLTGTVTLDAQGNENAVFVIQIDGAFSSSAASQVILKDSARGCNVFWKIEGTVSLGVNSIFIGTIISNSAIDLQPNAVLDGRALTRSGSITLDTDTARLPLNCSSRPLPLTLVDFEVNKVNKEDVLVTWKTQTEISIDYFNVEVSESFANAGIKFHSLGIIQPKHSGSVVNSYSLPDKEPAKDGIRYYRLKIAAKDGTFSYSNIKAVNFHKNSLSIVNIYPNPVHDNKIMSLAVYSVFNEDVILAITNMDGKKLLSRILKLKSGTNNITEDVNSFANGMYVLTISNIRSKVITNAIFQKL